MLVVDASAIAELLLGTAKGRKVAAALRSASSLHAPELLGVEVASVLRGFVRSGDITPDDAQTALNDLADLGLEWYEHMPLLSRALELRDNLTVYDAVYIALAEGLNAPLLTCDAKLGRASGHRATAQLVS
ncbi:MAG: type II toxin-antitoxin system VapC family toxin [Actinomycetota bacterium]|nr:type II toxin-antitoxin system VapC family toxin [Actinomycetota bacterium]